MNYYKEIKNLIEEKEVNDKVRYLESNKETIKTYYEIGRLLIEAQDGEEKAKYGDGLIKKWSSELSREYGKGYNLTNLKNMRQLYLIIKKSRTSCDQLTLTWSHWRYLLPLKNENERNYYINRCIQNNLSVRGLINEIKTKSFDRLSYADKKHIKLITDKETSLDIKDMIHDPILINIDDNEKISEKVLKKYILKELEHFFLELGTGFTFVGSEYKLSYDNKNYYVDLLLFNTELNRYIVCELKLGEIKPRDVTQTKVYMMLTDKFLKRRFHNETIGIIITRKNGKLALEYVSDPNIFVTTYRLSNKVLTNI
ncbi:probable cytoplasmic protein [Clostridium sp. CAG:594]|nr:probable cytoplasmic protein [Clostridium sp. CAG:594]